MKIELEVALKAACVQAAAIITAARYRVPAGSQAEPDVANDCAELASELYEKLQGNPWKMP